MNWKTLNFWSVRLPGDNLKEWNKKTLTFLSVRLPWDILKEWIKRPWIFEVFVYQEIFWKNESKDLEFLKCMFTTRHLRNELKNLEFFKCSFTMRYFERRKQKNLEIWSVCLPWDILKEWIKKPWIFEVFVYHDTFKEWTFWSVRLPWDIFSQVFVYHETFWRNEPKNLF